jgi:uridine kinase
MRTDFVEREPSTLIVLEGAYSCRPELADLIDVSVLVDVPVEVRHGRLAARAEKYHGLVKAKKFLDSWHSRWDAAEEYYLTQVRPRSSFDLVVDNA